MLALIPARSGSVRVPDKNIYKVKGHPLLAYTIQAALKTKLFNGVYVATDSLAYKHIAEYYGAIVPGLRSTSISESTSPDREWVEWILSEIPNAEQEDYAFILRPTSPFRRSETIVRAWNEFGKSTCDTLRAVRPASEHPGKMWLSQGEAIVPLLPFSAAATPWHSNQTAALFNVYIQDASLEIFTIKEFLKTGCITGSSIAPFFNIDHEGFDINTYDDIERMHKLLLMGNASLEQIDVARLS